MLAADADDDDDDDDMMSSVNDDIIVVGQQLSTSPTSRRVFNCSHFGVSLGVAVCVCRQLRAPECNMPLIRFLISALYMFACLHRMLPHLSFFLHFSLLIFSLTYLFL